MLPDKIKSWGKRSSEDSEMMSCVMQQLPFLLGRHWPAGFDMMRLSYSCSTSEKTSFHTSCRALAQNNERMMNLLAAQETVDESA